MSGTVGPLAGIRVLELAGLGPAPFICMLLSDLGAEVLRIDRPASPERPNDILNRGRSSLLLDLKADADIARLRDIAGVADVLVEGFRPGVAERLGIGPDELCIINPRLIYARMTGWGQDGPLAQTAGHDINFIALAGALAPIGRKGEPPVPPLNLVGDFGGGALFAAMGIVSALYERERSGRGQVIDAAMVDGAASLLAMYLSHQQGGRSGTGTTKGEYLLDGSAPFYRCYECADGKFIAVGAIELQFWQAFTTGLGLAGSVSQAPDTWSETTGRIAALIIQKPREYWLDAFDGTDACVTPVLELAELSDHPHLVERGTFAKIGGLTQPAPAPRFSRTPGRIAGASVRPGEDGERLAAQWLSTGASMKNAGQRVLE